MNNKITVSDIVKKEREDEKYGFQVMCDLIERQLESALADCKVLRGQERAKKEARSRVALIFNAISSARHHLGRLEGLIDS